MSSAWKNSRISTDSGAPPETAAPQAAAEACLHLRVHEPVGEAVLDGEATRDRPALLAQHAHPSSDIERPVDEPPPDARGLVEPREDGRVDLLVDARHAREDRRPDLQQRIGDGVRIGAEGDRVAGHRREEVRQAAEVVCEREIEQQQVVLSGRRRPCRSRPWPSRSSCGGGSCRPWAGRSCPTCR